MTPGPTTDMEKTRAALFDVANRWSLGRCDWAEFADAIDAYEVAVRTAERAWCIIQIEQECGSGSATSVLAGRR